MDVWELRLDTRDFDLQTRVFAPFFSEEEQTMMR